LDVFAGAGSLGLEALSRGASHATFIDNNKAALKCLRENVDALDLSDISRIIGGEARRILPTLQPPYHWIFVDPPYASDLVDTVMPLLAPLLGAGGLIIVEHDRRNAPPERYPHLVRTDQRRYGDTCLALYKGEEL
jgi:16S rRNA (guanine(966)-N(2))-methyltransferase RsmD